MSVYVELKKPEHRKEDLWRQHLHWWEVMSKQVDENLVRRVGDPFDFIMALNGNL